MSDPSAAREMGRGRSQVSDAHQASWVPQLQRGLAGKFRAGHGGGEWGDSRAGDANATAA